MQLFDKCRCTGFYKKAHDGVYIFLDKDNLTANLMNSNSRDELVEKDIDCAEKVYYEYKNANFSGVVVGFVELVVLDGLM